MSTLEKVIIGLLVVLVFLLFGTLIVSAEDNDVGICTDPNAVNFMDAQWFPDYNIIENGSCEYPIPYELEYDL